MIDDLKTIDPWLIALGLLLRLDGVKAGVDRLSQLSGAAPIGIPQILRCAKKLGLKAVKRRTNWAGLATTQLPAIATLRDGGFLLIGKVTEEGAIVVRPSSPNTPKLMTRAQFEAIWDGRLVLMARRVSWLELARRFTWSDLSARASAVLGAASRHLYQRYPPPNASLGAARAWS